MNKAGKFLKVAEEALEHDQGTLMSAFRLERLYRKYKYIIFLVAFIIVCAIIYYVANSIIQSNKLEQTSDIITRLRENVNVNDNERQNLENELKKINPVVYDYYLYAKVGNDINNKDSVAILQDVNNSKDTFLKDMSNYNMLLLKQDSQGLREFKTSFKDNDIENRAKFESSFIMAKNGDFKNAKITLSEIKNADSDLTISIILLQKYIDDKLQKSK